MPKRRMKRHAVTQPSDPSYRLIPLTQGQNAIVDAADFEWLSQWNWCAMWNAGGKTFYARRKILGKNTTIAMHSVILECLSSEEVDHWNHNTLDNRRGNLRKCTSRQNKFNQRLKNTNASGYKGVSWHKGDRRWRARIRIEGRAKFLGNFISPQDAARAYDEAAKKVQGEFAVLNASLLL